MDAREPLRLRPDRRNQASRDQLLRRIEAEFREMPGLRLTRAQAERLFGLRSDVCDRVLAALVAKRLIRSDRDGCYRVVDDAPVAASRERPAE